ncbi:hypothetical protein Tco_1345826 [Tanacetum coccineum]
MIMGSLEAEASYREPSARVRYRSFTQAIMFRCLREWKSDVLRLLLLKISMGVSNLIQDLCSPLVSTDTYNLCLRYALIHNEKVLRTAIGISALDRRKESKYRNEERIGLDLVAREGSINKAFSEITFVRLAELSKAKRKLILVKSYSKFQRKAEFASHGLVWSNADETPEVLKRFLMLIHTQIFKLSFSVVLIEEIVLEQTLMPYFKVMKALNISSNPRQNVVPTAEKTDSSQQGLEFLFSPLLEEYYNPAHGHAEDNNNDQAPNASFQEAEFINPFLYTGTRIGGEPSSRTLIYRCAFIYTTKS